MDDLCLYYDKLYADKDYAHEVAVILEIFGKKPRRVLDVGCGTGNHAFLLAEKGIKVHGIDPDPDMIEVARQKCGPDSPLTFSRGDVSRLGLLDLASFDLIISMFNVVNYIMDMAGLLDFFSGIYRGLAPGGVFIFDCWNGIAALIDPPHSREGSFPRTDRMNQQTIVDNRASIDGREISFTYTHRLWTPVCLEGLLALAGFQSVEVSAWMKPGEPSAEEVRRIMFLCRKA